MTAEKVWALVQQGFVDTLYMTIPATILAYLVGLPLGVLLVITRKGGIRPLPTFNKVLDVVINFLRSVPFIILLVMLFPVTRVVMGTSVGTRSVGGDTPGELRGGSACAATASAVAIMPSIMRSCARRTACAASERHSRTTATSARASCRRRTG